MVVLINYINFLVTHLTTNIQVIKHNTWVQGFVKWLIKEASLKKTYKGQGYLFSHVVAI